MKDTKPRLIAFAGAANSGKDTAAQYLVQHHGFVRYGFADPIKRGLNATFGWSERNWHNREWKEGNDPRLGFSPRKAAQTFGTEWGRQMLREDLWLKLADMYYEDLKGCNGMVISDCRYDNEAEWVKSRGGEIFVLRRNVEEIELKAHSSEKGISEKYVDGIIFNNESLSKLYALIETVVNNVPLA